MGYSFIPVFLGMCSCIISGGVYQQMLDKVVMVRKLSSREGLTTIGSALEQCLF